MSLCVVYVDVHTFVMVFWTQGHQVVYAYTFDVYIQALACLDCFCAFMCLLCIVQTLHIHIYIVNECMYTYTVCNDTCVQLHTKPITHRCVRMYRRHWKLLCEIGRFICILIKWLHTQLVQASGATLNLLSLSLSHPHTSSFQHG